MNEKWKSRKVGRYLWNDEVVCSSKKKKQ
jgi:hypothetical protein